MARTVSRDNAIRRLPSETSQVMSGDGVLGERERNGDRATAPFQRIQIGIFPDRVAEAGSVLAGGTDQLRRLPLDTLAWLARSL
jgi:hypothetical protein